MEKEKKASSHIEMVLAFVVFFTFVIFLLIFIKPYDKKILPESVLTSLETEFKNNVLINLTTTVLRVDTVNDCVNINFPEAINTKIIARDTNKNKLDASASGSSLSIQTAEIADIIIAEGLVEKASTCTFDLEESNYTFGSLTKKQVVSYEQLVALNQSYYSSYEQLKTILKIPANFNFAILSNEVNMVRLVPDNYEVNAKTLNLLVLYSDGTTQYKDIILKIW